jgi:alcohol dehydrogenase
VIRVTLTTICGTDLHILKGRESGKVAWSLATSSSASFTSWAAASRITPWASALVEAITPCGQCKYCLSGEWPQCGGPISGRKFGNTINGAQAEYLLVPNAQANLAKIPDDLSDEQVVLLADIASPLRLASGHQ